MPKQINVKVIAPDSELEFSIQPSTTGKQLFEQVARTLGVREIWYFGISFVDTKGNIEWLKLNKKVLQHNIKKQDPLVLKLTIKFYPEDVEGELIQEITKKYFFMHIKQAILCDEIYCPSDTCVLLASYALQAKYGDFENEKNLKEDEKILPQRVVDQHNLSTSEWREKIFMWWREHRDMLSVDAMTEHLKIVQDLEMYGVQFFDIKNKKGTQLLLGVDALGLNIYEKEDKLNPKIGFPWSEIRNISFNDRKFIIKAIDRKAPDFVFYTGSMRINKCILALCMGNHDHYMRRRKADTIEIQQMRAHAKEEKQGKLNEKRQSVKSREEKEASDKKTAEAYEKLRVSNEQYEEACRRQKQTEENMQIMHERMQEERVEHDRRVETLVSQIYVKEDNLKLLESDKYQVEQDLAMARMEHEAKSVEEQENSKKNMDKLEEEKKDLELKIHLASIEHQRQRDEFDNIGKEYELLKQKEVIRQISSEEEIKVVSADMDYSANIQNDRSEENRDGYLTMDINVDKQKQLKALREDLDLHQKEGSATTTDLIHIENMKQGRDKFKTLKQIRRGNTKCRVDQFESQ